MKGNIETYKKVCDDLLRWDEECDDREIRRAKILRAFVDACKTLGIFVYYKYDNDFVYSRLTLKYKGLKVEIYEEDGYLELFLIVGQYNTDDDVDEAGRRNELFALFNLINQSLHEVRIFLKEDFSNDLFDVTYGSEVVLSRSCYFGNIKWNDKVSIEPARVSLMLNQLVDQYFECRFSYKKPESLKLI